MLISKYNDTLKKEQNLENREKLHSRNLRRILKNQEYCGKKYKVVKLVENRKKSQICLRNQNHVNRGKTANAREKY